MSTICILICIHSTHFSFFFLHIFLTIIFTLSKRLNHYNSLYTLLPAGSSKILLTENNYLLCYQDFYCNTHAQMQDSYLPRDTVTFFSISLCIWINDSKLMALFVIYRGATLIFLWNFIEMRFLDAPQCYSGRRVAYCLTSLSSDSGAS